MTLTATGGTAPYTWTMVSGTLPPGLTLSAAGVISGTSTTPGTYTFTLRITDAAGQSVTRQFSLTVNGVGLTIDTTALSSGIIGTPYTATFSGSGGTAPLNFSISAGSLPTGLTLTSAGALSGTPTQIGTFTFSLQLTDAVSQNVTRQFQIVISATTLQISTQSLASAAVGAAYTATLAGTGGVPAYTWSLNSGTLPAGLSLSAGGVISGTPTVAGTSVFTVRLQDTSGQSATRQLTLTVNAQPLVITTQALTSGTLGSAYNATISLSGGTAPFNFSVSSGTLPAGITLSTAGVLSGTPTAIGTSNFTVNVTDASAQSVSQQFSITVNATTLSVATQNVHGAIVNTAYSTTLSPAGGVAPYTWSVTAGSLPAGISLSAAGGLSGTPTVVGTFIFTAQVSDGSGQSATRQFSLTVNATPLRITTSTLTAGTIGVAYSATITTSGGLAPFNFSVSSGALPTGITLSIAGVLSGTPTALGTSNFTVNVTDASAQNVSQQFSITINATTLSVATQNIP
ncbi:MAG: putative Ig domain-containing protein, partial [Terriglobales bacterium]